MGHQPQLAVTGEEDPPLLHKGKQGAALLFCQLQEDHVGLHLGQIQGDAGQGGQPLGQTSGPAVIVRQAGDVLLGLASSGVHSNGFSLVRKVADVAGLGWEDPAPFGTGTLGEALLVPTRLYVRPLLAAMRAGGVHALAHITGGGITENVPRILRDELTARIDAASWTLPPLFQWLQQEGKVDMQEMYRVFNCGIGMAVVVAAADAEAVVAKLEAAGETVYRIGRIDSRREGEAQTIVG